MGNDREDPAVRTGRREAMAVGIIWAAALTYTVTCSYLYGYDRPISEIKFVRLFWGIAFPDWIFWGIVAPWSVCFVISWWFSYVFMTDADLGKEVEDSDELFATGQGGDDA